MGKLTISTAIFNSYFDITRGYMSHENIPSPGLLAQASIYRNAEINHWCFPSAMKKTWLAGIHVSLI